MCPEEYLIWSFHSKGPYEDGYRVFLQRFDLLIRNLSKFFFFLEVLSDQSVHVSIKIPLPGSIRMSKNELGTQTFGNALMHGKFFSIVRCKCVDFSLQGTQ